MQRPPRQRHGRPPGRPGAARPRHGQGGQGPGGFGLVEILIVVVVVAIAAVLLYKYVGSTAKTMEKFQEERPLAGSRLVADQATLGSIRAELQVYHAQHGQWPSDKAAALAALSTPPRFQCPGNDFEYDPAAGQVRLVITDPARC